MSKRTLAREQCGEYGCTLRHRMLQPTRSWLRNQGYTASTIEERVRLLAGWTHWMHGSGFAHRHGLWMDWRRREIAFKGKKSRRAYAGAGRLFIAYLQDQTILSRPATPPSPAEKWPVLGRVLQMGASTSWHSRDDTRYSGNARLSTCLKHLGDDPRAYTAQALRELHAGAHETLQGSGGMEELCRCDPRVLALPDRHRASARRAGEYAVPSIAGWKLATISRYLVAEDIARVIAACDGEQRLRDKAIVLLLARLGLRASEVAHLKLADIDWRGGRVAIARGQVQTRENGCR